MIRPFLLALVSALSMAPNVEAGSAAALRAHRGAVARPASEKKPSLDANASTNAVTANSSPSPSAASDRVGGALLPPPVAPGMEKNSKENPSGETADTVEPARPAKRSLPPDLEIERAPADDSLSAKSAPSSPLTSPILNNAPLPPAGSAPKETPPDPNAARKLKIKTDRERQMRDIVRWEEDMAGRGSTSAMRALGFRYLNGDGVEKDEAKGLDWLRKAAAGGEAAAKKELAKREKEKQ